MAVLCRKDIVRRLDAQDLVLTPLLDPNHQIGATSVDVRLGSDFITIRKANLTCVDPANKSMFERDLPKYQEVLHIPFGEDFVLHPRQLVLGSTLEYVKMPNDIVAEVVGRSSWARVGLIIAWAPSIAPGFKGVITLELANEGELPLVLRPGFLVAQLVFQETSSEAEEYRGRYFCPTMPQFTKLLQDSDISFWSKKDRFFPTG